ncbi:MAG: HAMP domain-containing protein [Rhodospirillaceae bacterium]|nr:HAMP domain-containing protein [Rhodospirillaceae bacterium]
MSSRALKSAGLPISGIGGRIYLGFAPILVLLMIVAGAGFTSLRSVGGSMVQMSNASQRMESISTLERDILSFQSVMTVYLQHGSLFVLDEVNKTLKAAREAAAQLQKSDDQGLSAAAEGVSKQITDLTAAVARSEELFGKYNVVLSSGLKRSVRGAHQTLNQIGQNATDLDDAMAEALSTTTLNDLMTAEIKIGDFFAAPAQWARVNAEKALATTVSSINLLKSQTKGRYAAPLKALEGYIATYQQSFATAADIALEVKDISTKQVPVEIREAQKIMSMAVAAQKADLERVDQSSQVEAGRSMQVMGWSTGVALLAGVLIAWLVGRGIVGPVKRVTDATTRLADGDLNLTVTETERKDEVGAMARALKVFQNNLLEAQERDEKAKANLEAERRKVLLELADSLEKEIVVVVQAVGDAAVGMKVSSNTMSDAASQTSDQANMVAGAANQASQNVQNVAAASEQLYNSIAEIARQVTHSSDVARQASSRAADIQGKVTSLNTTAEEIGTVVELINGIAAQTNLLALNATIEAARAGDAGKGFAVVANEVKDLATQTAKATEEIGDRIRAIQQETLDAVDAIAGIAQIIEELDNIASTIAASVEEQGAATQEIARNVQEASNGTAEVTSGIETFSVVAEQTGRVSRDVLTAADDVAARADQLRDIVEQFLGRIRNA